MTKRALLSASLGVLAVVHLIAVSGDRLKQFSLVSMLGEFAPGSSLELLKLNLFMHAPMILFTPLVGALLDRSSKGLVLLGSCALRAGILLCVPFFFNRTDSFYVLYAAAFVLAVPDLAFASARSAIIPDIVEEDRFMRVNALIWVLGVLAALGGFLGGGWLFDYRSWQTSFIVNALLYAGAGALMIPLLAVPDVRRRGEMPHDPKHPVMSPAAIVAAIADGFRLIRQNHAVAIGLLTQTAVFAIGGVVGVIGISHIQEVAEVGRALFLGIVATSLVAGLIAGSGLASVFRDHTTVERAVSVCTLLAGVAITGLGRTETIIPLSIWAALAGLAMSPPFIVAETLIQQYSPRGYLGRVFAAREAMIKIAYLSTAALATGVNAWVSKPAILVSLGLFLALMGVVLERTKWLTMTPKDSR